ncbi:predicted protein [Histoplasma mississippiense (nom. inval.)]|uniref:predicted protein n=1 Tax=Ajellomyces capsulatus (strain NAm1 / WU24) TaxID=2059318 RepID=UPI000157CD5C|nr:predicted protein [Histoplasma mississippiense (nom. inval.)]EDN10382.1 predicted protein [Histoplasma mississippiense (nom. inval.)]
MVSDQTGSPKRVQSVWGPNIFLFTVYCSLAGRLKVVPRRAEKTMSWDKSERAYSSLLVRTGVGRGPCWSQVK